MTAQALSIGWASTSITPDQPVQLAGQMHQRISESVHDPCTATALALEGGGASGDREQAIMVCCDLVSVGEEIIAKLRERVSARLPGFEPRKLLVNCTHTHTAPTITPGAYPAPPEGVITPEAYGEFFLDQVTEIAVEAWQNRKPGGISFALGHAALGYNRRLVYSDGSAQMYGKSSRDDFIGVEGPMDPGIELAFTWDMQGKLTGTLVNIACPSQVVEGELFVSADYWHPAREELRKRLGDDLFVYPMCSAAGDQSPRDLVRRGRGEPNMRKIEGMNELGRRLAVAVEDALHSAQTPVTHEPVFEHHFEDLPLPMRRVTAEEAEEARRSLAELTRDGGPDPASREGRFVRREQRVIERYETQGDDPRHTIDMNVLRLGDLAIATNPFELFLEFGLRIKGRSLAEYTMPVQLANGKGTYLPTTKAIAGGSYSALIHSNLVGPEGGDVLVERTVELINSLWPAEAAAAR